MRKQTKAPVWLFAALLLSPLSVGAQKKPAAPPPSSSPKAKAPAPKTPATKKPATPPAKTAKAPAKRPAPVPIGQKQPTRDRYQEIQTALADAGYFQGPADGKWGAASIEALRTFQADQGLEPTGKIDARSLMQLGLGPNYGTKSEPLQAETNPPG